MNVSIESSVITDVFNRKLFKEYGNYTGGGRWLAQFLHC
jgi:hypothetical protein